MICIILFEKELFKSKVKLEEHIHAENIEEAQQLLQDLAS